MREYIIRVADEIKTCMDCPCMYQDGPRFCGIDVHDCDWSRDGRDKQCPLIELPPHGRLVDAGKVASIYIPRMRRECKENGYDFDDVRIAMAIADAPTIVEASE